MSIAKASTEQRTKNGDGGSIEDEGGEGAKVKAIRNRVKSSAAASIPPVPDSKAVSVDDFLRNFLCRMGMTATLDCFQSEWAEMMHKGQVDLEQIGMVPDIYTQNQSLARELKNAQREKEEHRLAASVAAEELLKARKTSDIHRLRHVRLAQERNRLLQDVKKLKAQCDHYEPEVTRMNEKYRAAVRQMAQVTMERDKLLRREGSANPSWTLPRKPHVR